MRLRRMITWAGIAYGAYTVYQRYYGRTTREPEKPTSKESKVPG